ncbi:Vmc-like lipoprotein signal peptide domain-containing protein [Ureaplasma diversum]|uniref:Vmc-like lipoprotein signal peptide domain-containing protein n=1 Tax=Ureaplasma diversum TaxID=42094 RepID=UPI000AADC28D|nr:iron ABC transporter substrate-binding protein [Ureaplasma diversum]
MKTKKTFQKRLLASVFGAVALAGVVGAVAASCTDTKPGQVNLQLSQIKATSDASSTKAQVGPDYELELSDKNSLFRPAMTDPYKAFEMIAKNFDAAGYKIKEHAPLKDKGFETFEAYAKDVNTKIKAYVRAIANLDSIKALRAKNTTVLYAETTEQFDKDNAAKIDNFFFQQPTLFPILYADPESETPGFGMHMPTPNSHSADKWYDNWYGIGAATNSDPQAGNTWRTSLYEGYRGTADFIFYNYNSNKLLTNTTKEQFEELFKKTVKSDKIIPVDFQFDYASIWGPVGTMYYAEAFARRLGATEQELQSVANLKPAIPKKEEMAKIRPSGENGENVNLAVHFYNLWDHMIMLGITPDYSQTNDTQGKYKNVAGIFAQYIDESKTDFVLLKDRTPTPEAIASAKLYAYAANESYWNKFIQPNLPSGSTVKGVLTERGDTAKTTTPFDQYLYNRKTNTLHKAKAKAGYEAKFETWKGNAS